MVRHSTDRAKKFFSIFELIFCQKLGTYIVKKTPKNHRLWSSSLGATAIFAKAVFSGNQDFPPFLAGLCNKKCCQNFWFLGFSQKHHWNIKPLVGLSSPPMREKNAIFRTVFPGYLRGVLAGNSNLGNQ